MTFEEFVKNLNKEFYKKPDVHKIMITISQLSEAKLGIVKLNRKFKEC